MSSPRFVSLFAGVGGLDHGFIKAGFKPVRAYDNWDAALSVYRQNLGDTAFKIDLSDGSVPRTHCDVVISGSPCQGYSTVGKRDIDDPRNSLLQSAIDIALSLNPKVVVFENVLGLISGSHKVHFDRAVEQLTAAGYSISSFIVDARDCGVPQSRRRVFIVGWNLKRSFEPIAPKRKTTTLEDALTRVTGAANHDPKILKTRSNELQIARRIGPGQKLCDVRDGTAAVHTWDIPEVFGLTTSHEKAVLVDVMRLRRRLRRRDYGDADPVDRNELAKIHGTEVSRIISSLLRKGFLREAGKHVDLRHAFNGKFKRPKADGAASTVDSRFGDPLCFLHPTEHRGFSVREAARIQGFPDSFIFSGSMRDQYKMVGNAVPPPMGTTVGKMILEGFFC